jgi:uncharacterized MAPEG superfamily protein
MPESGTAREKNAKQNLAMTSDLLVALVLAAHVGGCAFQQTHEIPTAA